MTTISIDACMLDTLQTRTLRVYFDIPGFCKAETIAGIGKHDLVFTPRRYVGTETQEDDGEPACASHADRPFTEKYPRLLVELEECFGEGERLTAVVRENLERLAHGG